jgi:hypothetical protein
VINTAIERVRRILESRRVALEAVTRRLIESEVIDGSELREIVEMSTGAPQIVPGTDTERRPSRAPGEAGDIDLGQADASGNG